MSEVIEKLKNGVVITAGPGMWQLIHQEFLSEKNLMDHERLTTFTIWVGNSRHIKLRTNIVSLWLAGPKAVSGGRAFIFISQGHWDLALGEGSDSYSSSVLYRGFYNPIDRTGTIQTLSPDQEALIRQLM